RRSGDIAVPGAAVGLQPDRCGATTCRRGCCPYLRAGLVVCGQRPKWAAGPTPVANDPLPTSLVRPSNRSPARAYFECDRQVQPVTRSVDAGATFERRSDQFLSCPILIPDDSAGQNQTAQPASPKGLRIGDEVGCSVLRDLHLPEAGFVQQT